MSKFLKHLFFFIVYAVIGYMVLLCVYGEMAPDSVKKNLNYKIGSYGHTLSRMKEVKTKSNIDILFLGSSHAYRGFDTRIFSGLGYSSFNLGSSAQTPFQTNLLLRRYLDRLHPKMVVYEVYPATFCTDGVESTLDLIANDTNDFNLVALAFKQNHIKIYNNLIYDYYRELFNLNSNYHEPYIMGHDRYISGGFVEKKLITNKDIVKGKDKYEFNTAQFACFEKSLQLLRERKVKVILVQAPMTRALFNTFDNSYEFDQKMKKYGSYYNFNTMMKLNDTLDFFDKDHLNQRGVKLFDNELAKKIKL